MDSTIARGDVQCARCGYVIRVGERIYQCQVRAGTSVATNWATGQSALGQHFTGIRCCEECAAHLDQQRRAATRMVFGILAGVVMGVAGIVIWVSVSRPAPAPLTVAPVQSKPIQYQQPLTSYQQPIQYQQPLTSPQLGAGAVQYGSGFQYGSGSQFRTDPQYRPDPFAPLPR